MMRKRAVAKRALPVALVGVMGVAGVAGVALLGSPDAGPVVGAIPVRTLPIAMTIAARTGRAFVVNSQDNSVGVVDMGAGRLLRTVTVGYSPVGAAVDARGGRVFVADNSDANDGYLGSVTILDATTGRVVRREMLVGDVQPLAIAVDSRHALVYVVNKEKVHYDFSGPDPRIESATVEVLDATSGRLLHAVALTARYNPLAIALDEGGGRAYVASVNDTTGDAGTLSVIDGRGGRLLRTVPLHKRPDTVAFVPAPPARARGDRVLVTESDMRGGFPFIPTTVATFDAATGRLLRSVTVPSGPVAGAVDARTGRLYTLRSTGLLGVIAPPPTISAPARMTAPFAAGNLTAHVPSSLGGLNMLDARTGLPAGSIPLTGNPLALAVDEASGRVVVPSMEYAVRDGGVVWYPAVLVWEARHGQGQGPRPRTIAIGDATRLDWSGTGFASGGPGGVIAVDERSGHVLVAVAGGAVTPPVVDPWRWLPHWLRQRLPFATTPIARTRTVPPRLVVLDPSQ